MLAFVLNSDSGGKKTRAERLYFSSVSAFTLAMPFI